MRQKIFKILIYSWLILFSFFGAFIFFQTPEQMKNNSSFRNKELKPAVNYIENYLRGNGSIPTSEEFNNWQLSNCDFSNGKFTERYDSIDIINLCIKLKLYRSKNDLPEDIKISDDVIWSKNYLIAIWRSDSYEYYSSWNNIYSTDNYNWYDGIISLFIFLFIGSFPLIIYTTIKSFRK